MEEEKSLAKWKVGDVQYETHGNILTPFRDCYVVTTAGQIWDIRCLAFSCDESHLLELWATDRSHFRKRSL
jgi:hypothetical protein